MRTLGAVAFLLATAFCVPHAIGQQAVPILDPNACAFPDASLVEATDLLEAPAGTHGRVFSAKDGHFYFEDGTRALFWGINVAKESVFQPRELIDEAIAAIARAGFASWTIDLIYGLPEMTLAGRAMTVLEAIVLWGTVVVAFGLFRRGGRDPVRLARDLEDAWEVLTEPVQTVLRAAGVPDGYELLKAHSRGKPLTRESLATLITSLPLPEAERQRLLALTPAGYVGLARQLAGLADRT